MEFRVLQSFLTIAREGSMTKAAAYLHVTQPTLSKQMKELEQELGKKLFIRQSYSVKLTDEGMLLRKRAEDVISMMDKINSEFLSLNDITGGELYIGSSETYQIRHLALMIKAFKTKYPNLHYFITSGDTEQVTEKLDKGLLDFALISQVPDLVKYNALELPASDIWGIVMRSDCMLAQKKVITIDDLIGLPLFCSEQGVHEDLPRWCGERTDELTFEGFFRLSYNASIFAKEGLGYLLTFEHLVNTSKESGLVFRPLFPVLETKLYIIWKKFQMFTPIAELFLKEIKSYRD